MHNTVWYSLLPCHCIMFQCPPERHIHFYCYCPSICKLMEGHFRLNHEFERICALPQKIYCGMHMIFPSLSFSHSCLEMLWIFCSLGNSFYFEGSPSLQLFFLTSPRAIRLHLWKKYRITFSGTVASWLERAYAPTDELYYIPEQDHCIKIMSWEWSYFHANLGVTAKNSLAQDKILIETKLKT